MPDITISTEPKKDELKPIETEVKKAFSAIQELEDLKKANDDLEKEIKRTEELKARMQLGGKSLAGQYTPEKTPQELAAEEAAKLIKQFR